MNSSVWAVWAVWAAQDSMGKLALNEAAAANALNQPPPFIGETQKLLSGAPFYIQLVYKPHLGT